MVYEPGFREKINELRTDK